MKKRLVRILLILAVAAMILTTAVLADETPLEWNVSDGVLQVSGDTIPDYSAETPAPWLSHAADVQKIEVADGVTSIGANAFADLAGAQALTLPGSVTSLGENALPEQLRGAAASFGEATVAFGAEAIGQLPAVPEREGYAGRWGSYTLKNGQPAVVEPVYELAVYHASFVADGETVAVEDFTTETDSIPEPEVPAKTGYTGAWEEYTLRTGDLEIRAVYTPITYHATFVAEGKTVATVDFTVETVSLAEPAVPAKSGYQGTWEAYTLGAKDITVQAVYTLETYQVTFVADGKTVKTASYTASNPNVTAPAVPAKAGYTGAWESYKLTTGNVAVKAVYTPVTYYVTFVADGSVVAKVPYTVESHSVNEPAVPAKSGFRGVWASYNLGTSDITVQAVYSFAAYQATVTASLLNVRTGPSTGTSCCGGLYRGTTVTITAEQSDGSMNWGRLESGGWVSLTYVSRIAEAPSNPGGGETTATSYTATVNASYLNVRSGPGTGYGVQGGLSRGSSVTYVEEKSAADGTAWCRLSTGGWVSKTYLANIRAVQSQQPSQPEQPAQPSQPSQSTGSYTATVRVSTTLNVRSGPGTSTSVVGSLRNGTQVTVSAETTSGGMTWAKISSGWVSKSYLTNIQAVEQPAQPQQPAEPEQPAQPDASVRQVRITASVLNVRSGPGTGNSIVGSLRNGDTVEITETSGNWGRLSGGGWICMDYTMDIVTVHVTGDFKYTIASYATDCSTSSSNRKTNLRLACEAINGTILAPGGTFSYNGTLGERTPEKGYQLAPYYGAGGVTYGGGICQVSSTLFNAVLSGNLEVLERFQHVQSVSYVPKGRDAAVNWGTQDFRFRNNSNYYIQIVASTDGNTINIALMTREDVSPASNVTLDVVQSGNLYTLYRYYNGQLNYTTTSRY